MSPGVWKWESFCRAESGCLGFPALNPNFPALSVTTIPKSPFFTQIKSPAIIPTRYTHPIRLGHRPLQCPCCGSSLRRIESISRPEAVEFFLRLHGLWEGLVNIPPPPDPPFDIDTFMPIDPPWPAIREWIPAAENDPQAVFPEDILSTHWVPTEIRLDDERTLILDPS